MGFPVMPFLPAGAAVAAAALAAFAVGDPAGAFAQRDQGIVPFLLKGAVDLIKTVGQIFFASKNHVACLIPAGEDITPSDIERIREQYPGWLEGTGPESGPASPASPASPS